MNIIVTGGAGFIGRHTCLVLLEKGFNVYVIDSFENSSPKSLERVIEIFKKKLNKNKNQLKIFKGNLSNKGFLKEVFELVIIIFI